MPEYKIEIDPNRSPNKSYLAILNKLAERGYPPGAYFADDDDPEDFNLVYEVDRVLDDETVKQLEKIPGVKVKRLEPRTPKHDAAGGLLLLKHLGLDVTEEEKVPFVSLWDSTYQDSEGHFLTTVCRLYGFLPFAAAGGPVDEDVRNQREEVYTSKINSVELEPWMRE